MKPTVIHPDQRLTQVNENVQALLDNLARSKENNQLNDDDIMALQLAIQERERQLQQGFDEGLAIIGWDRSYLTTQLGLTKAFEQQAVVILTHYQSMLHFGHKSKRQLKVYQTIAKNK
ncbi:hypothetical protein [Shewanella surugensis]|uniref:Uncharacterized protein n=1 Tax=Shewanella surugensis TaxID=212020 RepID=A0ABT0LCQ3_9GAMM|nr:hypothetical protein [Shewanella surugensis]MCL1125459.1 hypothetical protein [Shewanella surugensis]